jgi:hypothetical protein
MPVVETQIEQAVGGSGSSFHLIRVKKWTLHGIEFNSWLNSWLMAKAGTFCRLHLLPTAPFADYNFIDKPFTPTELQRKTFCNLPTVVVYC